MPQSKRVVLQMVAVTGIDEFERRTRAVSDAKAPMVSVAMAKNPVPPTLPVRETPLTCH